MSVDILKNELRVNKIRNLYIFYGPEEYRKRNYLQTIEKKLLGEDLKSLNKIVFEGKVEVKSVIECCETMPVFSEKKLVVVKDSGLFKPRKKNADAEEKASPNVDELISYLSTIPEYTCLIFVEHEVDKRLKLFDAARKIGLEVEFGFMKPSELKEWVIGEFARCRKKISASNALMLLDRCDQGMNDILNEIQKIILYVGDRTEILPGDIEKVCTVSIKSRIFDLTDAIAAKDGIKALKVFEDMIASREPVPLIFYMIARQFSSMLEMKLLTAQGLTPEKAAQKMATRSGMSAYAAGILSRQAAKFTAGLLKQAVNECSEMDLAVKSGRMNEKLAVEILIARFADCNNKYA